jgi:hypothetical protein
MSFHSCYNKGRPHMYILPLYNFQHFQFEHGVFFELKPIRAAGQQQTDWTQSWFPSSPRKTVTGSPPPPPPPPHGRFHHQQVAPLHSTSSWVRTGAAINTKPSPHPHHPRFHGCRLPHPLPLSRSCPCSIQVRPTTTLGF